MKMELREKGGGNREKKHGGSSNGVGNHSQRNFNTLVECMACGVESRVITPSNGLTMCENPKCNVAAFFPEDNDW